MNWCEFATRRWCLRSKTVRSNHERSDRFGGKYRRYSFSTGMSVIKLQLTQPVILSSCGSRLKERAALISATFIQFGPKPPTHMITVSGLGRRKTRIASTSVMSAMGSSDSPQRKTTLETRVSSITSLLTRTVHLGKPIPMSKDPLTDGEGDYNHNNELSGYTRLI